MIELALSESWEPVKTAGHVKIGDTVRVMSHRNVSGNDLNGLEGTVCNILRAFPPIGVNFAPVNIKGHDCGGRCPSLYGQYLNPDELEVKRND